MNRLSTPGTTQGVSQGVIAPNRFRGARAWFRADSGVTISTGVSSWVDKLGNGYTASQAVGGNQPVQTTDANYNGHNVLTFNGSGQCLQATSFQNFTTAFTAYIVGEFESGDTSQQFFEASNSTTANSGFGILYSTNAVLGRARDSGGVKDITVYKGLGSVTRGVWCLRYDGSKLQLFRNGVQWGADKTIGTLANTINQLWIGAIAGAGSGFTLKGRIADMVFCNVTHTDAEMSLYNAYFSRYNLSKDLGVNLVIDGDSLSTNPDTNSSGVQQSFQQNLTGISGFEVNNTSVGGMTLSSRNTTGSSEAISIVDTLYKKESPKNILIAWLGTNDLQASASGATTYSRWTTYINERIAKGWTVIGLTSVQRSGAFDAARDTFNTSVRSFSNAKFILCDVAALSMFDTDGDENSATYYQADATHIKTAGNQQIATLLNSKITQALAL